MTGISEVIESYRDGNVALYGIGTETERFIAEYGRGMSVIGLLDSFRETGEIFGYPIISLSDVLEKKTALIIVVARPGSCKAITGRIGGFCKENDIALYDVRGRDLLSEKKAAYTFDGMQGYTKQEMLDAIADADVISFDLFDTLVTRKTMSYTDVFDIMELRLKEKEVDIPEFATKRLMAEKELSKDNAPTLTEIYEYLLQSTIMDSVDLHYLADLEYEIDSALIIPRNDMRILYNKLSESGKTVVITTDTYYTRVQIESIIDTLGFNMPEKLFVSCEHGTSKTQRLYEKLVEEYPDKRILHIGDDEIADIKSSGVYGINSFRIYSGADIFDHLGGLGLEGEIRSLSDRIRLGMFMARIFNSPFMFEEDEKRVFVSDSSDLGYLFSAPMISDYIIWLKDTVLSQEYDQMLFCARDGYLPIQMFKLIAPGIQSVYFLSSRTAAIRAGMEDEKDIAYVDSMKYSGTPEDALRTRFGICVDDIEDIDRNKEILERASEQRSFYQNYIDQLGIHDSKLGLFDFVAKGTSQLYIQKLFSQAMKGFYFLQLEPEFMSEFGLNIEPFYTDKEKDTSEIFENYYILETMLTAPFPQMLGFGADGEPVYAEETRSETDLKCVGRAQQGILEYFKDYITLLPESERVINKKLDEKLLALVNKVLIKDEDFLALKVEDPFFGRMTDIRDVIG